MTITLQETATGQDIKSQPAVWREVLEQVPSYAADLRRQLEQVQPDEVLFDGCGTSLYVGMVVAPVFQRLTGWRARAVPAYQMLCFADDLFRPGARYLPVFVSRSGQTKETVQDARAARERLGRVGVALTGTPDSELARMADLVIHVPMHEKSIIMTQSFSALLLAGLQLSSALAGGPLDGDLRALPSQGEDLIDRLWGTVSAVLEAHEYTKFAFLGSGPAFGIALEATLKMSEMAYVPATAWHILEYHHGGIATVDRDMLTVAFVSDSGYPYELKVLQEVIDAGGTLLVVHDSPVDLRGLKPGHAIAFNSGLGPEARLLLHTVVAQMLGYYMARKRGINPDSPRALHV